ncbi:MAG: CHAT domain-containing protein, partial [Candidatus Solibacter sp.]|nr:CHAT domain-containing protein [Candidatus Solibacter sp.]
EMKKPEFLDVAIDALLEALRLLPQGGSEASNKMMAASEALAARFAVSSKKSDIDRAVDLARLARKNLIPSSGVYSAALALLAGLLRQRNGSRFKRKADLAQGIAYYREAVRGALAEVPMIALESGIQWGAWAHERQQWEETAEALLAAMDAHQKVLDSQRDRLSRELRLKRIQGLGALAASSLLRSGQVGRAMVALERGRGLLAAQALDRRPEQVTFLSITEKVSSHPLVYLEDVDGGYGLLVRDGAVEPLSFPHLREEMLNLWLEQNFDFRESDPIRWERELGSFCRWLWEAVMGPLIDALHPANEVTLVAGGYLGMLPLHAAWKEDPSRPTGRFYAADALTIRYAPSVASLRPEAPAALGSILCVDEPSPVKAPPLPFSKAEVGAAAAGFAARKTLRRRLARRDAVLRGIPDCDVLHLSCHGRANLAEPLENGFLMSGGEFLTLRDLFGVDMSNVALAVLSACDTGQMGTGLPDHQSSGWHAGGGRQGRDQPSVAHRQLQYSAVCRPVLPVPVPGEQFTAACPANHAKLAARHHQ